MNTNQSKSTEYSSADYERPLLTVAAATSEGFPLRFTLQIVFIALSALVVFGCSKHSSLPSYYQPPS